MNGCLNGGRKSSQYGNSGWMIDRKTMLFVSTNLVNVVLLRARSGSAEEVGA